MGSFYPPGTSSAEFLPIYASHFTTVEIDTTYYRILAPKLVKGWFEQTPPGVILAAEFPGEGTVTFMRGAGSRPLIPRA
ncbi:MAG TPA: DUF72 domain-containing protein [Terriglobia bacterium]|nr:DUF72 domain-containing protein [Terriglobia bacterium]